MASNRLVIPETLTAGDTWQWDLRLEDFSPADYTLKLSLRGAGSLDITATDDDGSFQITAAGLATSQLTAGTYAWVAAVFDSANNRTEIARGAVEILEDIFAVDVSQSGGYDGRSHNRKMYDAICAQLEGRASRVEQEYTIGGRMLKMLSLADLEAWKGKYAWRVRYEKKRAGQLGPRDGQLQANFGPPVNKIPSDGGTIL